MTERTARSVITRDLPRSLERDTRVLVFGLLGGAGLVLVIGIANPSATLDELAAVAAVPLIGLYVLSRLFGTFVAPPTDEDRTKIHAWRDGHRLQAAIYHLLLIVSVTAIVLSVLIFSTLGYLVLGLGWAAIGSTRLAFLFGAVSMTAVAGILLCCLIHENKTTILLFVRSLLWYSVKEMRVETDALSSLCRSRLWSH